MQKASLRGRLLCLTLPVQGYSINGQENAEQEAVALAEYEVVREIQNSCEGNRMRDIFFDETETDDPVRWIRENYPADDPELDVHVNKRGEITVFAHTAGLNQKFLFTKI